ncbi:PstA family ABC transporter permease [Paraliomyxa miuraensis]|uniref:PstA family ABC transporter permease n=1 Tax=Paraliomyxa miuraensis TaxID=376150 RepID=UPI0022528B8E|nr:ABC transporter permease subunit [Paraliomyxa miuraensis]MCX4242620.1 ABC transporter permease subunit [Paraliomyxa miuraensis]
MTRGERLRPVSLGPPPRHQRRGRLFAAVCMAVTLLPVLVVAVLLGALVQSGAGLDEPTVVLHHLAEGGAQQLLRSVVGSLWLVSMCACVAVPLGVGAALQLEGPRRPVRSALALNIASLAGVPSVLFGLVGLELFVRALHLGHSMVTAALTLALVVLPIVAVAARSALRAVPDELREAGYALGATPWQVTRQVVLPAALPGILSGTILAIARAFGEAAPLLLVAGMTMSGSSTALGDPRGVLPLHVLALLVEPRTAASAEALVGVVVLLGTLLVLSGWAMHLRHRHERRRDGPWFEDPR